MQRVLEAIRKPLFFVALISVGVNLLMLVSPIFMLQVFDRVLTTGHLETLYGLLAIAFFSLVFFAIFDALRQIVLLRAVNWMERQAGEAAIYETLARQGNPSAMFRNIGLVRSFVGSPGIFALLDAPWILVFTAVLWWMHPLLGISALTGAVILLLIGVVMELVNRRPLGKASAHQYETQSILEGALANIDAVVAMGMTSLIKDRWKTSTDAALSQKRIAGEQSAVLSGLAKAMRTVIQISVLAIGAVMVVKGELTAGGMIASSILLGRCLAPVEQGIGAWRNFIQARLAWGELRAFKPRETEQPSMSLPDPKGELKVSGLSFHRPGFSAPVLDNINLQLAPGSIFLLMGPSGSGKSTLSRLLVGAEHAQEGQVTLDGRMLSGWNRDELGKFIGYLPQDAALLPGSIRENIARFREVDPKTVVQAAQLAGVDLMIRGLPDGYDTMINPDGSCPMSAGQRQRIGLARALFCNPRLVVLDEPNSNLDTDGEQALRLALSQIRKAGACIIIISHRPSLLKIADQIGIMSNGKLIHQGKKNEIISVLSRTPEVQSKPGASVTDNATNHVRTPVSLERS